MIRVGVIGMRGIGSQHAEVYVNNRSSDLVAVCDLVKERADGAAERFGAKSFESVPEMLRCEELDAVSVATGGFRERRRPLRTRHPVHGSR